VELKQEQQQNENLYNNLEAVLFREWPLSLKFEREDQLMGGKFTNGHV